ncbi:hypothetical protein BCR42DRAFT_338795 [Absidia repens]|uniref:Reverse transcriptase zinc-binding domain-containing protein n=1 Tax=Absidia repens TaxID=90262 RepID=A0A1X2HYG2_9FUNG|nr:hypothetical protein BCR42DRAFT_338795 [Absidia repens]
MSTPPFSTKSSPLSPAGTDIFWKAPMTPEARTIWYKILVGKVPLRHFLRQIGRSTSSLCHLCTTSFKDTLHFQVGCPTKNDVWTSVLGYFFPHLHFSIDCLYTIMTTLTWPSTIWNPSHLLVVIGTTLRCIWIGHWQSSIHNIPFQRQHLVKRAIRETLHILTPLPLDD